MVWGGDPRGISIIQDEKLHIIGCVQQKKQLSKRFMLCCQQLEGSAERSSETLPTLLIHSIVDEGLDINDIVNIVGEDLGHPLPDDNENRGRNEKPRNQNYFEITIPRYTDIQFVEHFRMSRGTFEELLNIVAPVINQQENANIFEARSRGFTDVIGAIDGCHIPCKQPIGNANDYYNRKGFHSIILQGVCNHQGLFIDCFIGMPGRMHDARVFRNSPLFNAMRNGFIPRNLHIIGDSAYPLLQNLMTPFKDNGHLTRSQLVYNTKLSSIRSIIERAFGILKSKFRRLKYLDISNFDLGNNMIAAACVLHNFILNRDGLRLEDEDFIDNEDVEVQQVNNVIYEDFEASEKRRNIAEQF